MRSNIEIKRFVESLGITEEDFRSTWGFYLNNHDNLQAQADYGLALEYGDAFSYRGYGIVVLGETGAGKTALCQYFKRNFGSRILGEDHVLLFDPDGSGKLKVYEYPSPEEEIFDTLDKTIAKILGDLSHQDRFPLGVIIHLEVGKKIGPVTDKGYKPDVDLSISQVERPHKGLLGIPRIFYVNYSSETESYELSEDTHIKITSSLDEILLFD